MESAEAKHGELLKESRGTVEGFAQFVRVRLRSRQESGPPRDHYALDTTRKRHQVPVPQLRGRKPDGSTLQSAAEASPNLFPGNQPSSPLIQSRRPPFDLLAPCLLRFGINFGVQAAQERIGQSSPCLGRQSQRFVQNFGGFSRHGLSLRRFLRESSGRKQKRTARSAP